MLESLEAACAAAGLDIVHPFSIAWLDRAAWFPFSDHDRSAPLGVLIGNTAKLWPEFMRALRTDDELRRVPHPLDTYVTRTVATAVNNLPIRSTIFWAHQMTPAPIPIQRIAERAGLARIAPSHLSIHPQFGPWIALRALVVMDANGPAGEPPALPDPCASCAAPCVSALRAALAASHTDETRIGSEPKSIEPAWRAWLEVRNVCPSAPRTVMAPSRPNFTTPNACRSSFNCRSADARTPVAPWDRTVS